MPDLKNYKAIKKQAIRTAEHTRKKIHSVSKRIEELDKRLEEIRIKYSKYLKK